MDDIKTLDFLQNICDRFKIEIHFEMEEGTSLDIDYQNRRLVIKSVMK